MRPEDSNRTALPLRGVYRAHIRSTTLALAVIQALVGQRPVSKLTLHKRDLLPRSENTARQSVCGTLCDRCRWVNS